MVALAPPRKYWLPLLAGVVLVILLAVLFYIPLLWSLVVAALLAAMTGRLTVRRYFMFLFWLLGAEFVFVGVVVALGGTLAGIAAFNAMFVAAGLVLGIILILIGVVLFVIGNLLAD